MVWKITLTTLGDLPCISLFLLRTSVVCVMGATPMFKWVNVVLRRSQYLSMNDQHIFGPFSQNASYVIFSLVNEAFLDYTSLKP